MWHCRLKIAISLHDSQPDREFTFSYVILTKTRACEHLQKFFEHLQKFCKPEQASTHLIFASQSSKGQILRALSNWLEPFDTPLVGI